MTYLTMYLTTLAANTNGWDALIIVAMFGIVALWAVLDYLKSRR